MEDKNLTLLSLEELPETDKGKEKVRVNCMVEILQELMFERKITDAEVVKATGVPFSTWDGWAKGKVGTQLADRNLLSVARFFNVSIEYLCFGVGSDNPMYEEFEEYIDNGFKNEKEK